MNWLGQLSKLFHGREEGSGSPESHSCVILAKGRQLHLQIHSDACSSRVAELTCTEAHVTHVALGG